jgi:hypothetical protein
MKRLEYAIFLGFWDSVSEIGCKSAPSFNGSASEDGTDSPEAISAEGIPFPGTG